MGKEPQSQANVTPIERAYDLWAKVKGYSSLIARLKITTNSKAQSGEAQVAALAKFEKPTFWDKLIISPDSVYKREFDNFIAMIVLADLIYTTFNFFVTEKPGIALLVFSGIFFLDIILKFFHGFMEETNQIMEPAKVALHYLKGYFVFDLIATIPLHLANERLCWLRFIRFLHFADASTKIITFLTEKVLSPVFAFSKPTLAAIGRLIRFIIILILALNLIACIWVNIGREPNSWVTTKDYLLIDRGDFTVYLAGLYWACTVFATVGYGDFAGNTTNDLLFTMAVYMFGVCLFSYLLGNVNGLLTQMNLEESIKTAQVEELEEWLIRINRLGKTKTMKNTDVEFINEYMKSYWRKDIKSLIESNDFMWQLPPNLRRKLFSQHLCVGIAENFDDFFGELEAEFALRLIPKMDYCRYTRSSRDAFEDVSILKPGKVPKDIYFVLTGYVGLYSTDGLDKYTALFPGTVYGEAFVMFDIPASYWFKYDLSAIAEAPKQNSEIKAEMYKIKAQVFMEILKDYPAAHRIIRRESLKKRMIYRQAKRSFIQQRRESEGKKELRDGSIRNGLKRSRTTEGALPANGTENSLLPKNPDDAFKIMDEYNNPPLEPRSNLNRTLNRANTGLSKLDAREQLFNPEKQRILSHNEILEYEYLYNSEDEFGNEDAFEKQRDLLGRMKESVEQYKKLQDHCRSKLMNRENKIN